MGRYEYDDVLYNKEFEFINKLEEDKKQLTNEEDYYSLLFIVTIISLYCAIIIALRSNF